MRQSGVNAFLFLVISACALTLVSIKDGFADVEIRKNEHSGLLTWALSENGFSLELIQLLPDFVRAIYAKHDFTPKEIERIANYCVFGTIIKNTSGELLNYDVSNWEYINKNKKYKVKTKTQWINEWRQAGITFSWTLLPDKGSFEAGDWQQGFTTIKLPRNEKFNFYYNWQINGQSISSTIENIECAPETISDK